MNAPSAIAAHSAPEAPAPARPIVVYDGDCPFCRRQIDRFRRLDRAQSLDFTPKQTDGLFDRFPKLGEGDFNTGMRFIEVGGNIQVGADAVYQIFRRLPRYRTIAWLYRVPLLHTLCKWGYAWIARNRYRLAGGKACTDETCEIK